MVQDNLTGIDISVVIPVYFNEGSIRKTFEEINRKVILKNPSLATEVIFVDDGSQDNSWSEIISVKSDFDAIVKAVKLTRNFGQVSAILAGYTHARGKMIINVSADMQDPVELMNEMIQGHLDEGYEIVACTREQREDGIFRNITSKIFYSLMKKMSFANMPEGGFDYVLISRKILEIILKNHDANPFWQGQILWPGYQVKFIPYTRRKRETGTSKWTFFKKIKYLLDGLLAYSYFPLRVISLLGILISLAGFLYAAVIIVCKLTGKIPVEGWAPIMVVLLVLMGLQMIMLGVIGEYLWRVLEQTRQRQPFIVETLYE